MHLTTPVIFSIFNRPDLTEMVFAAIAKAKPRKLFVIADGPRFPEEAEKCQETRSIIERVDWDCEVITDYSDKNVGMKEKIARAYKRIFSEVEEAIVLEDDTLPAPSFFSFCQTLLDHYRDDERIMHICGGNFLFDKFDIDGSYYFSRYPFLGFGWASWARAWKHYDPDMRSWPEYEKLGMVDSVFEDPFEQQYWKDILWKNYREEILTYDFQWFCSFWSQNGLAIHPAVNLVSNLGFRPDATHTKTAYERMYLANIPRGSIDEITHPKYVVRHRGADRHLFQIYFGPTGTHRDPAPTGLRYYWVALKYKLGLLRSPA